MTVPDTWARIYTLALVPFLLALVPLAHATPPDPLWIGGIYDGADSDDVVLAGTSLDSSIEGDQPNVRLASTLAVALQ